MERGQDTDELLNDGSMAVEHPEGRDEDETQETEEVDENGRGSMNADDVQAEEELTEQNYADEEDIEDDGDDGDDEEEEEEEDSKAGAERRKRNLLHHDAAETNLEQSDDHDSVGNSANAAVPAAAAAVSTSFPLSRVKTIMKLDPEVTLASQEAVSLLAMATRLFVAGLARDAARVTAQHKKKTLQRRDLDAAVDADPAYAFLEGMIET